jgi:hypothetical protein
MMNDETEIKALNPATCPHCSRDIVIETRSYAPRLASIYTPSQLRDAKEGCLRDVEMLPVPLEKKASTLEWLRDEDLIVTPDDVPNIIQSIIEDSQ